MNFFFLFFFAKNAAVWTSDVLRVVWSDMFRVVWDVVRCTRIASSKQQVRIKIDEACDCACGLRACAWGAYLCGYMRFEFGKEGKRSGI